MSRYVDKVCQRQPCTSKELNVEVGGGGGRRGDRLERSLYSFDVVEERNWDGDEEDNLEGNLGENHFGDNHFDVVVVVVFVL